MQITPGVDIADGGRAHRGRNQRELQPGQPHVAAHVTRVFGRCVIEQRQQVFHFHHRGHANGADIPMAVHLIQHHGLVCHVPVVRILAPEDPCALGILTLPIKADVIRE